MWALISLSNLGKLLKICSYERDGWGREEAGQSWNIFYRFFPLPLASGYVFKILNYSRHYNIFKLFEIFILFYFCLRLSSENKDYRFTRHSFKSLACFIRVIIQKQTNEAKHPLNIYPNVQMKLLTKAQNIHFRYSRIFCMIIISYIAVSSW